MSGFYLFLYSKSMNENSCVKNLSEMSLEELWELFPVFLVPPSDKWESFYSEIENELNAILSAYSVKRISHVGSTAIAGIWSKDIVDVLVEIPRNAEMKCVANAIESHGFIRMSTTENRNAFNRGYTKNGFADKVFHVHLRYEGDNDELYFRDYLNEHPQVAKEYERLKLQLWKLFEHDRDGYTNAKTEFVKKWTAEAKKNKGGSL